MKNGPKIVYIRLLEACNANCMACRFAGSKDEFRPEFDKLKKLIDELGEAGTEYIRITGGEPLIYNDIVELLKYIEEKNIHSSIITNGLYLENFAEKLIESKVKNIICSLDSSNPLIHNAYRGVSNLFHQAIKGLECIRELSKKHKLDIRITINTIISSQTYKTIFSLYDILQNLSVSSWNLLPIKDCVPLQLNYMQLSELIEDYNDFIKENNNIRVSINTSEEILINHWENNRTVKPQRKDNTCVIPLVIAYIDLKNGEIVPCNCLPHRSKNTVHINGIGEKPFSNLWNDLIFVKERNALSKNALKYCTECDPSNMLFNENNKENILNNRFDCLMDF
jgi:cytosylglucuronate decarboxylase